MRALCGTALFIAGAVLLAETDPSWPLATLDVVGCVFGLGLTVVDDV